MATTREILVVLRGGKRRRVSGIPADAKITYGPVSPGNHSNYGNALRVYTSKDNQLAVFTDVEEFRDLSLTVKEQKLSTKVKQKSTVSANGSHSSTESDQEATWEEVD